MIEAPFVRSHARNVLFGKTRKTGLKTAEIVSLHKVNARTSLIVRFAPWIGKLQSVAGCGYSKRFPHVMWQWSFVKGATVEVETGKIVY